MAVLIRVAPYAEDEKNLPVADVEQSVGFYEDIMGFRIQARNETPHKKITLVRDGVEIAIAENGGDPGQEGCLFEVDNVEEMFAELKARGLSDKEAQFRIDQHGDSSYKVFFVIAPDGLCFCLGERQPS